MIVRGYFGGWVDLSQIVGISDLDFGSRPEYPDMSFSIQHLLNGSVRHHLTTEWDSPDSQHKQLYEQYRKEAWVKKDEFNGHDEPFNQFVIAMDAIHAAFVKQWVDYRATRHAQVEKFLTKLERDPNSAQILAEFLAK